MAPFIMYQVLENWVGGFEGSSYNLYLSLLLLAIFLGLFFLIKGGDWLSEHSSQFAEILGVPQVIVGLTVVSIATSAPELFTSISALRSDSPGLVLGNIIGSNIANIGLILGISLLIGNINTNATVSLSQRICLGVITCIFCGILHFHPQKEIGLFSGSSFLLFIFLYLVLISRNALSTKSKSDRKDHQVSDSKGEAGNLPLSIVMLALATVMLWMGSESLVYGAKNVAEIAGVPEELIGFTLLALGTSLPELSASISLVRKQRTAMLLGNILGSNLFNIALIGGVAGVIGPVGNQSPSPWVDYLSLLLITALFLYWLKGKFLGKTQGIILLLLYLGACVTTWVFNT